MTGWQTTPLLGTVGALLAFDLCCAAAATAAIRTGLR
jgi:hypothetical protein